jgi:hypothetical protein
MDIGTTKSHKIRTFVKIQRREVAQIMNTHMSKCKNNKKKKPQNTPNVL